jgi:large subunit ribosomal protein L19
VENAQIEANKNYTVVTDEKKKETKTVAREVAKFDVGDTVDVHVRIFEGSAKERLQVFNGVVIAKRGEGLNEMFTVRRIVQGEGVERIFPVQSPKIGKLEVKRSGVTRRAKLYYLRDRVGKATKLREKKEKGAEAAAQAARKAKADKRKAAAAEQSHAS